LLWCAVYVTATLLTDPLPCTAPDRLHRIAGLPDLARKATSIIACVPGLECSGQLHTTAEGDPRAWAHWLDTRPDLAAEMDLVRPVAGAKVEDKSQEPSHSSLLTTRPSLPACPCAPLPPVEGEDGSKPGLSTHERGLNVAP